jgi:Ca2+-dependent lipid-binding protein
MLAKLSVCCLLALAFVHSAPINKQKLKFKVSARNLADKDTGLGTSDAYFLLYASQDGGKSKKEISRSDTISDQENPDWGNVFEFDFDRSKDQQWQFYLYDEDNLREDDTVGRVWVNVADYVDKGQLTTAKLDKDGYIIIVKSADTVTPLSAATPLGQIPLPAGTPDSQNLKFKISASGLPSKDDVGFIQGSSDPYVIITSTDGLTGKEKEVGRSTTVSSSSNPNWGDVFSFNWNKNKDQRLHFKIYDDDNLREDDKLGNGWIEVNDYVAKGQSYTLPLPKKGFLTISKA